MKYLLYLIFLLVPSRAVEDSEDSPEEEVVTHQADMESQSSWEIFKPRRHHYSGRYLRRKKIHVRYATLAINYVHYYAHDI